MRIAHILVITVRRFRDTLLVSSSFILSVPLLASIILIFPSESFRLDANIPRRFIIIAAFLVWMIIPGVGLLYGGLVSTPFLGKHFFSS